MRSFVIVLILSLSLVQSGCGPAATAAISSGHNTALDSVDLVSMTDQMARGIAGDAEVRRALTENGKLVVVVQPVENRLTGEILPAGQAEAFTGRVRSLLSKHAPESFTWVMNRDAFYRLRSRELDFDLGPAPDRFQPEYALTATFSSLTDESSRRRSAAYLCVYELSSLKNGQVLWSDKYEVKKVAVKGFLD
jgi:hypothetical protein